jgi:phosphoribosyl-ATP pyrophosphohydrolase
MEEITARLFDVVIDRKANPSPDSYVNRLLEKGEDKILQKVGEEAVETILAAKGGDEDQLVHEIADLWFHLIVLLGARGIPPEKIAGELERRFGTSGLEEKRSRGR